MHCSAHYYNEFVSRKSIGSETNRGKMDCCGKTDNQRKISWKLIVHIEHTLLCNGIVAAEFTVVIPT